MAPRRPPANRRVPRLAKLSSRRLINPQAACTKSPSILCLDAITNASPSRESNDGFKPGNASSGNEAGTTIAAAVIELVVLRLETEEEAIDASSVTSKPSDGVTATLVQFAPQLQRNTMDRTEEGKKTPPMPRVNLRSKRTRRKVDVLGPPRNLLPSRKDPLKRWNVEKCKVDAFLNARPAVNETAAARSEAALKEKKRKRASSTKKGGKKTSGRVLSPIQDEKKKTPKTKRSCKARRSLEPAYSFDTEFKYVSKLIAELYEEQEQDDRDMYSITRETVFTATKACKRSQEVQELSTEEFRRLMTYGEVSIESVASTIFPLLDLDVEDVFFDLGCGTGKILVQAALQTPCKRTIGIELMHNRVLGGHKALTRLKDRNLSVLHDKQVEIYQGDIFDPPEEACLVDATVIFINNVMFGPQLMLKVMQLLKAIPKLRCVMTLRKICERHGHEKCSRAGNYCVEYVQPPIEQEIDVSWADKTSIYFYESVDYKVKQLTQELANGAHRVAEWHSEEDERL